MSYNVLDGSELQMCYNDWMVLTYKCVIMKLMVHSYRCVTMYWMVQSYSCVIMTGWCLLTGVKRPEREADQLS